MRTRSPNLRNGVFALPSLRISSARRSNRQPAPFLRSRFDIVPEPTIAPAASGRVFAACATRRAKSNCMSVPASGSPSSSPFTQARTGPRARRPSQASPSSSGVTATGAKEEGGLEWKKPKPLARSEGTSERRLTSFSSTSRRICSPAFSLSTPIGTSPVMTPSSISRSMPCASSDTTMPSQGPSSGSEQP